MIRRNLEEIMDGIAGACAEAGRSPDEVRVMAVTKTLPPHFIRDAVDAGVTLIGENRVTEGGRKIRELGRDFAEFHLIGPIHVKEARQAIRDFHCIEAVDRMEVADELARREAKIPLLVEVNTSGEASKKGFPTDYDVLARAVGEMNRLGLRVEGLMTVGPLFGGPSDSGKAFALLRELRNRLRVSLGLGLETLSMGMSDDYLHAVREGATTVRLGTAIFGHTR